MKENISFHRKFVHPEEAMEQAVLKEKILQAYQTLLNRNGKGKEFLGWLDQPLQATGLLQDIQAKAEELRWKSQTFVCVGIGGSYLGTRAIDYALSPFFEEGKLGKPEIVYAGHHLSEDYLYELLEYLNHREYTLCVISKSGTTTEPAIAFRILRNHLQKKYGVAEARKRIVVITDAEKGALRTLATEEGYASYVIPDNIGGRYSVLTAVGLFPLAMRGVDLAALIEGAQAARTACLNDRQPYEENLALQYVHYRQREYRRGKIVELLVHYDPRLKFFAEWWKQLFGESEGKQNRGIFPVSVGFTTDLHSLGQYIQDGERCLFETLISVKSPRHELRVSKEEKDLDGMNFVAGKRVSEVNLQAEIGSCQAHFEEGQTSTFVMEIPSLTPYCLGYLVYLFEFSCGVSAYALGVNPFDQPGVEAYKRNMFRLLKK